MRMVEILPSHVREWVGSLNRERDEATDDP
jgi:hypothetical protein